MSELVREENFIEPEGFEIDTDEKAKWALDKIREARKDRDFWLEWYEAKSKQIKEQTDINTMALETKLLAYFMTVPHKKTKTQESYPLPGGKLVMKTQNPEYKRDDKAVIEWLKSNKGERYVKVKEELDWAALKAATAAFEGHIVTEEGEVIPGITVENREPKFIVEV